MISTLSSSVSPTQYGILCFRCSGFFLFPLGCLFLRASVHFVHSSYSIHWLSQMPKEVTNRNSPAWNKGRIYFPHVGKEVIKAYSAQHAVDMASFLCTRADEVVPGGLMAILILSRPNGALHAPLHFNRLFDVL
ncbi:S-adenosyl-L-methionine-dependent methyltransferase superfamily protein [Abeliophyllum distichum]|uniref:S-adenosyl-L-methionine-dependent methyltransferase superfamily protein n=1 Tax=Abeliophyllum distichum TaxID=126358 RepID=A0ABD1PCS3_9LAMI